MSDHEHQPKPDGGLSAVDRSVGHRDTFRTDRPTCPHCGYEHDDAWEWNFGPGLEGSSEGRECYRCGEAFDCERIVDVSYTTKVPNASVSGACLQASDSTRKLDIGN